MKQSKKEPPPQPFPHVPSHLSERSGHLWREVGPQIAGTPARRLLLQSALEALDRAEQARQVIADEGLIKAPTSTSKMTHAHPLLRVETEARAQFLKAWLQLELGSKRDHVDAFDFLR